MKSINKRKMIATALVISFLAQQSFMTSALASDISGVTGNNGVYNINPTDVIGGMGFRKYENFTLSKGDIANLIFKYGKDNVSQFVNLVDNTININGLVNTVRDGKFYNGNAVFISPNGMVVGESGVLNVGSLSVYTPTQASYNAFVNNKYKGDLNKMQQGTADVKIDGKVFAANNINIIGRDAAIGTHGALIAGVENQGILTSNKASDILFNSLVNTGNIKSADTLGLQNGNIVIKTTVNDGGIDIAGLVKNNGKGNVSIQNNGTQELNISGKVQNANGNVQVVDRQAGTTISGDISNNNGRLAINNNKGQLNITSKANISNKGDLRITNKGVGGQIINGNVANNGLTLISSNAGDTVINGNVQNRDGMLTIVSNGSGLEIGKNAEISNNNKIKVTNTGKNGFTMNGTIKNNGSTALTNWSGNYVIGGTIANEKGKMNLSNASSNMHITKDAVISNNGDLQIINSGKNGLTIDGKVENSSTTNVWNTKGDMNINGSIENTKGKLTVTNDRNALNVNETGKISNDKTTIITNNGIGGLNYTGSYLNSGDTIIENKAGDTNLDGDLIQNTHKMVVKNSGEALSIDGTVTGQDANLTVYNTGKEGMFVNGSIAATGKGDNISIINKNGDMVFGNGIVSMDKGTINIANSGNEMFLSEKSSITNKDGKVLIGNSGIGGARIDSYIENNGVTNITNKAGDLVTNAIIKNQNGKLEIVNNGNSLTVGGNAMISNNSDVKIANTGVGGMNIKGFVENNGSTAVSNWNGDMVISGKIENQDGKMNITSAKQSNGLHLTKEGQLLNNNNELYIQNTGKNGMILDGEVKNNSTTTLYNAGGNLEVNGLVQNKGELMISNRGQELVVGKDAIIQNNGKTTIRNNSIKGMTIGGTILNQNDTLNIENTAGYLNTDKDSQIINRKADINITNSSGGAMTLDGSIYNVEGDNINLKNTSTRGGIVVDENALINTQGDVNMENYGIHGIRVRGKVAANDINIGNKDSHVYLGKPNQEKTDEDVANLNALNDVTFNIENGSLLNEGSKNTLIRSNGDLTINVNNGKIGVETGTSGGGYTYGPTKDQVDTSKSINVDVNGKINAHTLDTKKTNGDYAINLASFGSDMNIDHIYADGRVLLLTDKDADGNVGSVLNASTDSTKANIQAKGLSLASSGTIGTKDNALTVNDTNYAYKSNYQAVGDVNLKALDNQYKKADVKYIISNTGDVNAEFVGSARVKDTFSGNGNVNITNRTGKMNLVNKGTTPNTTNTDTYFDFAK